VEKPLQDPAAAIAIAKRRERVLSHLAEQPECSRAMIKKACATSNCRVPWSFVSLPGIRKTAGSAFCFPARRDESVAHTSF
jgi:hypothetical protein